MEGVAHDEIEDEEQPLLRRNSDSTGNQQFQEARHEAAQQAAMELGWFTWILVFVAFCALAFWFYVNIKSWYILLEFYGTPCDQPLPQWLLVKLCLDVLSSSAQQRQRAGDAPRPFTLLILGFQNAWLVLGFHWCSECRSCEMTNPELFRWVNFLIKFGLVVTVFLMALPVIFYMGVIVVVHLIGTGRIKNNRAARDGTLNLLEKVGYSHDLFADSCDRDDTRPACECCCCCEEFSVEKAIVRTPCQHLFHQACLGEWLKLAKTCPICRCDLDSATEALAVDLKDVKQVSGSRDFEETATSSSGAREAMAEPSSSSARSSTSSAKGDPGSVHEGP